VPLFFREASEHRNGSSRCRPGCHGRQAALRSGLIVLNVHTDAFNPGEISGRVEKS